MKEINNTINKYLADKAVNNTISLKDYIAIKLDIHTKIITIKDIDFSIYSLSNFDLSNLKFDKCRFGKLNNIKFENNEFNICEFKEDISNSSFKSGIFKSCKISGIRLNSVIFERVKLLHTDLYNADCTAIKLDNTIIGESNLQNTIFNQAEINNLNCTKSNLAGIKAIGAKIANAKIIVTSLDSANLSYAVITDTDFNDSNCNNTDFTNAQLFNCNFDRSSLTNSQFSAWKLSNVSIARCLIDGANINPKESEELTLIPSSQTNLKSMILGENLNLEKVKTSKLLSKFLELQGKLDTRGSVVNELDSHQQALNNISIRLEKKKYNILPLKLLKLIDSVKSSNSWVKIALVNIICLIVPFIPAVASSTLVSGLFITFAGGYSGNSIGKLFSKRQQLEHQQNKHQKVIKELKSELIGDISIISKLKQEYEQADEIAKDKSPKKIMKFNNPVIAKKRLDFDSANDNQTLIQERGSI